MTDSTGQNGAPEGEQPRHRVIGTPPPAESRSMLATPQPGSPGGPPQPRPPRELPAEPADLDSAKKGERIVAALFVIATLAGLGFIAAYVIFPVHTLTRVQHSNIALGLTMAVSFLALAAGAV